MATITENRETYIIDNGVLVEKIVEEVEVEIPTQEEIIAEKEATLLALYEEIQTLKG